MIKILNRQRQPIAILENAYAISYTKRWNEIPSASFCLPFTDPKNAYCEPLNFVELAGDLYRIIPSQTVKDDNTNEVAYECEHVIATLMDDVLFQYHTVTNVATTDSLQYILAQQTMANWQLGTVAFTRYFHYNWENENLASALFSVPHPFDAPYQWTYDTSRYPWTINLVAPQSDVTCEIRYAKNLRSIKREVDPTVIFNRIYALGYGEGVNQLTIKSANPTGLPYVEDAASIAKYGLRSYVWVDRRFENADSLYGSAMALLNNWKAPRITYSVSGADLSALTGESIDELTIGKVVRVFDPDFGTFEARIVSETRPDLLDTPYEVTLEIANKSEDLSTTQADLERRQQINELYAQGATSIDTYSFADNCDTSFPAVIKFYIPEDTARINKMLLSYDVEPFRAFSKAIEGGGDIQTTTASGGDNIVTTGDGGIDVITGLDTTLSGGTTPHTHDYYRVYGHKHNITLPQHTHELELPSHSHAIQYGIYEGPTPTVLTLEVDGNVVPGLTDVSVDNFNLIPYLEKDNEGKITRGTWHEVKIYPNDLGRVVANIASQIFVQSRGGGDY